MAETRKKDEPKVSDVQVSQAEALKATAGESVRQDNADADGNQTDVVESGPGAEVKAGGKVFVELTAVSWNRHDFETKKTKHYKRGAKLWITEEEFNKLSSGPRPRVVETDEEE